MSGAFVVNTLLALKMRDFISHIDMLPGVVPKVLADITKESPPFSFNSGPVNVGFFGGLSVEKGADIVLKLAATLPAGYVLHVTGTGPMAADFETCAKKYPERLCYHGRVDDSTLYHLIAQCDVMLNPHSSIENMNNGVFPFKVIEAVASGRLLISTAVPMHALEDVLTGVQFVEHNANDFLAAIVASRRHYLRYASLITKGADVANRRFGEDALLEKVRFLLLKKQDMTIENPPRNLQR
jgi:glycosyltransferase involved in cell wall biosynthesis